MREYIRRYHNIVLRDESPNGTIGWIYLTNFMTLNLITVSSIITVIVDGVIETRLLTKITNDVFDDDNCVAPVGGDVSSIYKLPLRKVAI